MQKLITKYIKDCDKKKESSYIQYWNVNSLYGWAMSQKLNNFQWIKDTSQYNEVHKKAMMKIVEIICC